MESLQRYRKIIMIGAFLLIVFLIGLLLYKTFFKNQTPTNNNPKETNNGGQGNLPNSPDGSGQISSTTKPGTIPSNPSAVGPQDIGNITSLVASGGLTKTSAIYNNPVSGAVLSSSGQDMQFYNQNDGKFYKIDDQGNSIPLSDKIFYNVKNITWSKQTDKVILEYPDGSNIVYNFSTQKQVTLPKHWENFDFSENGQNIVAKSIGLDPDNRWLVISSDDGSRTQALEFIGENADRVISSWSPSNQSVALYTKGVDFDRQELLFVGQNGENFKSTTVEGRGIDPLWNKDGSQLLYSAYNTNSDLKPLLWIVGAQGDAIGQGRISLNINTWASKCTFASQQEIYCAVPKELERGSGIFPDLAKKTSDDIYRININTGTKTLIAIPDGKYNIDSVSVSSDQSNLFFTDSTTKEIYKIELK
jgi:hypothetical protein